MAGRTLFLSTAVVAGSIVTPAGAVWNTTAGQGGGIVGGVAGDKYRIDRDAKFDPSGYDIGESGPMRPRVVLSSWTAAGGGSTGGSLAAGTYRAAFSWVDDAGLESPESPWSGTVSVTAGNIPRATIPVAPHPHIVAARLYLSAVGGALGTFTRYTTVDVTVSMTTTTNVDLSAAAPGTGILPDNGAVRLTHANARYWPSGLVTVRGAILDARTSGTGVVYAFDPQADAANTRFNSSASSGGTENIYGIFYGVGGVRGGTRMVRSSALASPFVAGTRPTIESAEGGTWQQGAQNLNTPTGDLLLLDARVTDYSDQPLSKKFSQTGAPAVGAAPTLVGLTGGTAGTGTLDWSLTQMTYRVAYAFATAACKESVRSPWSALIGPGAAGNIPVMQIPAAPAGTAYVHVFVQPAYMRPTDSCTRYLAFLTATPGAAMNVSLNKGLTWTTGTSQTTLAIAHAVWTGGEIVHTERCWFQRGGRIYTVGNFGATSTMLDRWSVFTDCVDAPVSWPSVSAIAAGSKEIIGTIYDTQFSPLIPNPGGLQFGTDTDPVYVGNFFPLASGTAAVAAGSRALVRATHGNGSEFSGDIKKWLIFVDGSFDFNGDRDAAAPSRATINWHGWAHNHQLLAQSYDDNDWVSFGTDGTGDLTSTLSTAPSGATTWTDRFNAIYPDMGDQRRRAGDIEQNGADTATQRIGLTWEHNTIFTVTSAAGENDAFHINETTCFPGIIKSYRHNLPWGLNGIGRSIYDFHGSGYRTDGPLLSADWNAAFGLSTAANVDGVATTVNGGLTYGLRDGAFRDSGGIIFTPDQRGGAGPLRDNPLFRAPYRSPLTYSWRERGIAVGASRPGGAVVSDGTAENRTALAVDMEDWCQWIISHWHDHKIGTAYVQHDGTSVTNVLEGCRAYLRWGIAPTAPSYNPTLNNGETPGAVAWVNTASGGLASRRRRRAA